MSAEALVRWQHPVFGLISPDTFIPLFEGNGKIRDVDRFVWEQAARQIARWRAQFGVTIPVSVNLSRIDVFDPATLNYTYYKDITPEDSQKAFAFFKNHGIPGIKEDSNPIIMVTKAK